MANKFIRTVGPRKPIAYPGKYIDVNGTDYYLVPEKNDNSCTGCVFKEQGYDAKLTSYCTQGYIFKQVRL